MTRRTQPEPLTHRRTFLSGHHDPRMVKALAAATLDIYHRTRAFTYAEDAPDQARELVREMRDDVTIFAWCREYRDATEQTVSNTPETAEALYQRLIRRPMHARICPDACQSITRINRAAQQLWNLAMDNGKGTQEREDLKKCCFALRRKVLQLIETGVTKDMPNTFAGHTIPNERKLLLAGVLDDRYQWCLRTATERGQYPWISALLGRATGLPMFDLVRDQAHGQCEIGIENLARSLGSSSIRARRGFHAEIGRSVFELANIAEELRRYGTRAGWTTASGQRFFNVRLVDLITMFQVIDAGGLVSAA